MSGDASTSTFVLDKELGEIDPDGYYIYGEGAFGQASHSEGDCTIANAGSHAEGYTTTAYGANSHAEGSNTKAIGANSHTEGEVT